MLQSLNNIRTLRAMAREFSIDVLEEMLEKFRVVTKERREEEEQQQRELAERLNLTPPSITAAIQKMEKMDYIKRTPDPHDQRVLRLSLTEKSRAYLEHIGEVSRQNRGTDL